MEILKLVLGTITEIGVGFVKHLPLMVAGLIIFLVFNYAAQVLQNIVRKVSEKGGLDFTLSSIMASLAGIVARILGVLIALVVVVPSFDPGSLIAGLGLSSVAIGFAFKDILQNFVAGVLILWNKPFAVGDVIETNGHLGTVTIINVRSTYIKTFDGKQVIIPNGDVFDNDVIVFSAFAERRISIAVGVGYGESVDEAQSTIITAINNVVGVLAEPAPTVNLTSLGASSVDFEVLLWIDQRKSSYMKVKHEAIKAIKEALDISGIDIPYPYQVVQFDNSLQLVGAKNSNSNGAEKEESPKTVTG